MVNIIEDLRADVHSIYSVWMGLLYPNFENPHPVIGNSTSDNVFRKSLYYIWSTLGVLFSILVYPITLSGLGIRVIVSRSGKLVLTIGFRGAILILVLIWGGLISIMIHLYGVETSLAVIIAALLAVGSAILAFASHRHLSRRGMIVVGFPATYTALFLPPITAGLVAPEIGENVLRQSVLFAEYVLVSVGRPIGVETWFRQTFELGGVYHIVLWAIISLVLGWITGILIEISKVVRPEIE